jgi:hypothetical protein
MSPAAVPLSIFSVLLLGGSVFAFFTAALGKHSIDLRLRLIATGLAFGTLYFLLELIGGLVK